MKTLTFFKDRNGFMLIATYLVITVVVILAAAYFVRSNVFLQSNERNVNKITAFNMAEAGISHALTQLANDPYYTGTTGYQSLNTAFVKGGFSVTVTSPDLTTRKIEAMGYAPDNNPTSRGYQAIPIVSYSKYDPGTLFDFAIFAKNSITLTGNDKSAKVDSYDSRSGAYDSGTAGGNGDIGVNSTAEDAITLNGTTIVKGDASVGPTGDPATGIDIGSKAAITGTIGTMSATIICPTPSTSLPSSGDKEITGGTETLLAGTYHFDSLKISGTGTLNLTGSVVIYVSGSVDITGQGIVTAGDLPTNLLIYVTGSEEVKIAGQGSFCGGIYAPNSRVKNVGNAAIFGAVVAQDYEQTGNAVIHFDEAMKEVEGDQSLGELKVKAWQEQNSLSWGT